ncbi:MAG: alanine racemase, partial [Candidatus Cloacimonetes bacterium]|nr:alanine racemase [Candidatus Cloacimonadota bacterium]
KMAQYFATKGWNDITVAFPVNINEISRIEDLAQNITLNLLTAGVETIEFLAKESENEVNIFFEIDTGDHRSGFECDDYDSMQKGLNIIRGSNNLKLAGLLTHAGQTYSAKNAEEVREIFAASRNKLNRIKDKLHLKKAIISIGDTPTCSILNKIEGVDEIRPGNFVFYDLMQQKIGSCDYKDIAVCLAAPVVSKNDIRKEIVIYAGAIHFSKEFIIENDKKIYGIVTQLDGYRWQKPYENVYIRSLSQEHGIIKCENKEFYDKVQIGDVLGILPVHSCLTANLMGEYVLEGEIRIRTM